MSENNNITSADQDEEVVETEPEEDFEVLELSPFWKSTIIRVGVIVVAVTIVKTAGRVLIARDMNRHSS